MTRKDVRLIALECGAVSSAALCRWQRWMRVGRRRGWVHGGWVHACTPTQAGEWLVRGGGTVERGAAA